MRYILTWRYIVLDDILEIPLLTHSNKTRLLIEQTKNSIEELNISSISIAAKTVKTDAMLQ